MYDSTKNGKGQYRTQAEFSEELFSDLFLPERGKPHMHFASDGERSKKALTFKKNEKSRKNEKTEEN